MVILSVFQVREGSLASITAKSEGSILALQSMANELFISDREIASQVTFEDVVNKGK